MNNSLPEAIQAMLKHAEETKSAGHLADAEKEYLLAFDYSKTVYKEVSALTGLVLIQMARFFEDTNQKTKAAIALGRANAIISAYRGAKIPG